MPTLRPGSAMEGERVMEACKLAIGETILCYDTEEAQEYILSLLEEGIFVKATREQKKVRLEITSMEQR